MLLCKERRKKVSSCILNKFWVFWECRENFIFIFYLLFQHFSLSLFVLSTKVTIEAATEEAFHATKIFFKTSRDPFSFNFVNHVLTLHKCSKHFVNTHKIFKFNLRPHLSYPFHPSFLSNIVTTLIFILF